MKFWLIQRGTIDNDVISADSCKGLTSRQGGLVSLDYMGSAEFEFGAVPKSYRRIMWYFKKYNVVKTDIKSIKGIPLCVFCAEDREEDIKNALKDYILKDYPLKESSRLLAHINPPVYYSKSELKYERQTNFWWDIQNDFMFFFGYQARMDLIHSTIKKDFDEWWMAKSEEDRIEDARLSGIDVGNGLLTCEF